MPTPRPYRHALPLILVALLARLVAVPIWKHGFEGHEREYLSAFGGGEWQASTRVYPLLAKLYETLGLVFSHPQILVGLNLAAAMATLAAVWIWARRRWSEEVAWMLTVCACAHTLRS